MRKDKSHAAPKEDVKGGEESNLAGYLNLSSTSLILFDEVKFVSDALVPITPLAHPSAVTSAAARPN